MIEFKLIVIGLIFIVIGIILIGTLYIGTKSFIQICKLWRKE